MVPSPTLYMIAGGGALVGLFVAVAAAVGQYENRRAALLYAALMVLFSIQIVYPLVEPGAGHQPLRAMRIFEPFQFLIPPIMNLYVRFLLIRESRLRIRHLLHALPFLAVAGFIAVPASLPASASPKVPELDPYVYATTVLWALIVLQAFIYLVPTARLVFSYRHLLYQQESNLKGIDLRWLSTFVHLFLVLYSSYAVLFFIVIHASGSLAPREYLSIVLSVLVFLVGQRALLQRQIPVVEALSPDGASDSPGAAREVLSSSEAEKLKTRLIAAMETDRLYLNPDLRLSDLVATIGATRNQVSYVINTYLGKNFYDFVNEYRVREVLRLVNEGTYRDKKITAIAFDSGFNSKPAFNAVFKKQTGLTPSEYRDGKRSHQSH